MNHRLLGKRYNEFSLILVIASRRGTQFFKSERQLTCGVSNARYVRPEACLGIAMVKLWYVQGPEPIRRTALEEVPPIDVTTNGVRIHGWEITDVPADPKAPWMRIEVEGLAIGVRGRAIQANSTFKGKMVISKPILPKSIVFEPIQEKDFSAFGRILMLRAPVTKEFASSIVVSEVSLIPNF